MDVDRDGYTATELRGDDCDDRDADVHPGAVETWYDGPDQDCSGGSDYDADGDGHAHPLGGGDDCDDRDAEVYPGVVRYIDADEDGWGDSAAPVDACDGEREGVPLGGDCDDANVDVGPGAVEVCDDADVDEDCDGVADDADESPSGRGAWYPDDDGDGYGDESDALRACGPLDGYVREAGDCDDADRARNPLSSWFADADGDSFGDASTAETACDPGAGWVLDATDCDDTSASVHPGAGEGCTAIDRDCDALYGTDDPDLDPVDAAWWVDADGDGFGDPEEGVWTCDPVGMVQDATDCDDDDAAANPAAAEECDGGDNDCDGRADDSDPDVVDRPTWYADTDADGWGDDATARLACVQPGAHVAAAGDCDDGDAETHPDAAERCGGGDEDCDGLTDDDDPGVSDPAVWYVDADGDGHGTDASAATTCIAPAGFVADGGDCDDATPHVSPRAAEDCATVGDDDCDGETNDEGATGCVDSHRDEDGDGWGTDETRCACVAAAPWTAAVGGDCDDTSAAVSPAGAEDCATVADDDCDGDANNAGAAGCSAWFGDADSDSFGSGSAVCQCVASAGAPTASAGDCDDGDATSWPGGDAVRLDGADNNCDSLADPFDLTLSNGVWIPTGRYAAAGVALVAGDTDGDGLDELLVGGPFYQSGGWTEGDGYGHAWLVSGAVDGPALLDGDSIATLTGEIEGDYAGGGLAFVGDIDGDGFGDLLVGAMYSDAGHPDGGAAYLVSGPVSGAESLSTATARLLGASADDRVGYTLGSEVDLDGDGRNDLLLGGERIGAAGTVYGVFGPVSGDRELGAADLVISGESADDEAGASMAVVGDVDGDGFDDLLIGAPGNDDEGESAGSAYLLLGPFTGRSISLGSSDAQLIGESRYDQAGEFVASAGDADGDGHGDLLVSARTPDAYGTYAGAVYLVLGTVSGRRDLAAADAILRGAARSCAGESLAGGQDLDGDGELDIVVGGYCDNTAGSDAGAVWVVSAGGLSGEHDLADAADFLVGEDAGDQAGWSLAVGQFDGDGIGDLAIGAPQSWAGVMGGGAVYLVFGGAP